MINAGAIGLMLAAALLMHAGYSAMQFEHWVKLSHQRSISHSLPFDIILECLAGLIAAIVSAAKFYGDFQPIRQWQIYADKSIDELSYRPSFRHFNHRSVFK